MVANEILQSENSIPDIAPLNHEKLRLTEGLNDVSLQID